MEDADQQIIMYTNQDPVLTSSSANMLRNSSRTNSPMPNSPGVANEIILPPGAMISKYVFYEASSQLVLS